MIRVSVTENLLSFELMDAVKKIFDILGGFTDFRSAEEGQIIKGGFAPDLTTAQLNDRRLSPRSRFDAQSWSLLNTR